MEEPPTIQTPPKPPPLPYYRNRIRQVAIASLWGPAIAVSINLFTLGLRQQEHGSTLRWTNLIVGGASCLMILCSLVMASVALLKTRRYGREGIFGPAIGGFLLNFFLVAMGILAIPGLQRAKARAMANAEAERAVLETREEARREIHGDTNVESGPARLGKIQKAIDNLAEQSGGDRAKTLKASSQYLQRMQGAAKVYQDYVQILQKTKVLDMSQVEKKTQLEERKEIVRKFMESNEQFRRFLTNSANVFKEELVKSGMSSSSIPSSLEEFRKSAGRTTSTVIAIRDTDRRLGETMLGVLEILEENWGKWYHDPQKGTLIFASTSTLKRYNTAMDEINTIADEQRRLQEQVLTQNK